MTAAGFEPALFRTRRFSVAPEPCALDQLGQAVYRADVSARSQPLQVAGGQPGGRVPQQQLQPITASGRLAMLAMPRPRGRPSAHYRPAPLCVCPPNHHTRPTRTCPGRGRRAAGPLRQLPGPGCGPAPARGAPPAAAAPRPPRGPQRGRRQACTLLLPSSQLRRAPHCLRQLPSSVCDKRPRPPPSPLQHRGPQGASRGGPDRPQRLPGAAPGAASTATYSSLAASQLAAGR
jgi:hypothetical protein